MSKRYTIYANVEDMFFAHTKETEKEALRRTKREAGVPQFTTITVPFSYAVMMTVHTYLASVFMSRSPVHQFAGRHGETEQQVRAIESVVGYQMLVGEMTTPYYVWLYDALKYGLGVLSTYWAEESAIVSRIEEVPDTIFGINIPGKTKRARTTNRIPGYVGNRVYNIRPQDFFPDPRFPVWQLQRGEFAMHRVDVSWNTIVKRHKDGIYFNIDALKKVRASVHDGTRDQGSPRMELPAQPGTSSFETSPTDLFDTNVVPMLVATVELIPKDWSLGDTDWPEKWVFEIANVTTKSGIIVNARPTGDHHNKYPYNTLEPELNGYSFANRGLFEIMEPLNNVMTWLFNSHFHNVRKVLNDQLIVDPSRLEMIDLLDPDAGRLIRLSPDAYGENPREVIHQLGIVDITRQNLGDTQVVAEMIQRIIGATDNVMGVQSQGDRETATSFRGRTTLAINRLKTGAEYLSHQGVGPHATLLVQNTQQYMEIERMFRVAGSTASGTEPFVEVTPDTILGFYDYMPINGSLPIDRVALANTMKEVLAGAVKIPQIGATYDLPRLFAFIYETLGVRNIDQFRVQVQPDAQVAAQAQAGNLVPLPGGGAPPRPRANPGAPRQVSGIGPLA